MSDNYQKLKEYRQGLLGKNDQAKPASLPQATQAEAVPDAYKEVAQNLDEPTTSDKLKGYLGGATVEMGGGIGGAVGYMKWLKRAKWASRSAKTNPAFWSNPWGWAAMAGGEAAIWGVSNLAGQEVRKAYGLQKEGTRVSEVYASAFFGLTLVTKLVEGRKIFEFAQPIVGEAFKSKLFRIGANGTKTVISGASLGLLESAFRQEIAIMMGEQKNGRIYEDYVASSAAGGGVNLGLKGVGSLWRMWRNSGAWGRGQAAEAVGRIQQNLEAKEANLVNKIEEAKTPSKATNPWVTAYGGAYNAGRAAGIRAMEKKLIAVRQAKVMNQQAIDEVTEANDAMTKAEKEAVNKPEEAPYTEDDLEVPPPSDKDVVEDAPKTPEQTPDLLEHEATFNNLKERLEGITLKDNAATEGPAVGVEANALKIERETKLGAAIHHVFVNKNADTGQVQNALDLVQFIRKLNTEVLDKIKVPAGRMVQSQRLDAAQFKFNERTSARAREEDFRLSELEKALKERLDGNEDVELDKMHQRYLDVVPEAKAEGKKIGKRVRKEFEKEQDISVQDPKEVAKQQAKTKVKLQKRLTELQKRFGDDSKLKPKDAAKKELADAEIEDLKERIKFYELNEKDALRLVDRLKERERLLKIETGPLSGQRAETNKPSLKAKRTPGDLEKVDADIAFLKKNMRNRVREIDRAQEELSPEFQAEQIAKAHDKAITRLDKELEQLQKEFGDMDAVEQQADLDASKPKPEPNPDIKDRQERIKFHKDARKEALKIAQLEKQFAETVEMEARGVMSEMRAATDPKPKGPKQPLKSRMIRKQISESKARMRKKVADIDKARVKMDEEASNLRVLKAVEKHLYETMLNETGDKSVDYARQVLALRQLSMISQPASATAGLGTGIAGTFKQLTRPFATLVHDVFNKNTRPLAFKNYAAEVRGLAIMFKDWEGTATAMKRTFKNMESATGGTGGRNRLTDEKQFGRRADYRSFQNVKANVERQIQAKRNLKTYLSKTPTGRTIWTAYELGVKSIMALDEIPRRQFLKGQQASEAIQEGHKSFPDDPEKAFEHAQELLNTRWKDDDGLRVLSAVGEQQNSTAYVNRELLFAGNATDIDESEFAETVADSMLNKLWRPLTNLKNHPVISLGARFVSPFMTVALRSGGRLARVGMPVLPMFNATNLPIVGNPYNRKLKEVEQELGAANVRLREGSQNPKDIDTEQKYIDALNEKKERIETRRILHNRDILADQMLGATFYSTGFLGAVAGGYVVGSQAWMTEDQRNTYGAKEFTMFGWSYKEWVPISLALSLGADYGAWIKIKDIERNNKVKILNDDQDWWSVLKSSAKQLIKDLPFNQSIKDMEGLANDSANVALTVMAKYLGSILPNPALVKKLTKYFQAGGKVSDLKGMDFWDRTVYEALGTGIKNWKTDDFGEDIETEMSGGQIIWRSIPDREKKETEWDYNKKLDYYNDIPKAKTMFKGLRMTDFKRDDGVHLQYAFNLELRKTNVKKSVFKIINNPDWKKLRDSGSVDTKGDGARSNPALSEIGEVLNDFNDQVVDRLLSRPDYLQTFVSAEENEKGTPAYKKYGKRVTLKQRLDAMERVEGRPDNFKPRPLEDLLKLTNQ
jgi:hypothetical protein